MGELGEQGIALLRKRRDDDEIDGRFQFQAVHLENRIPQPTTFSRILSRGAAFCSDPDRAQRIAAAGNSPQYADRTERRPQGLETTITCQERR